MYLATTAAAVLIGVLRLVQLGAHTWSGHSQNFVRGSFIWLALGFICALGVPVTLMNNAWLCSNAGQYYADKVGVFPICFMWFNAMYAALTRYCLKASEDPSLLKPLDVPQLQDEPAASVSAPEARAAAEVDDPAQKKTQ